MKTTFCTLILLLAAAFARAQTNDLTALLQQGLFEEQANRNLDAAIADYQTLAGQFDKDRQLAATAIFRLGECYREEGLTNQAAFQYQRILREFPDQKTLATLSQQDLLGMGMALAQPSASPELKTQTVNGEDQEIQNIQAMIQNSPDLINAPNQNGETPLESAAAKGQLKVAAYLLDHGADVNLAGRSEVPLIEAAENAQKTMVELLLSHDADINAKGNLGYTALHEAASHGFEAVTEVLLANHADVNARDNFGETPLILAAQKGNTKIVQMLLAASADPNIKAADDGETAVGFAVSVSPEIVKMLLAAGANPNTTNNDGRTPLSFAAQADSVEMIKMLLAAKADPNGGTLDAPLLCAIHEKDTTAAELLLQAGADANGKGQVDLQGGWGQFFDLQSQSSRAWASPLWLAVDMNQLPMVQLLLKFKANSNDSQSGTPVIFSALSDTNILEALLDAGANPNVNNNQDTPLGTAVAHGGVPESEVIMEQGSPYVRGNYDTPLITAISHNNVPATEILLKHGANPNMRSQPNTPIQFGYSFVSNGGRNTPLHCAAYHLADRKIFELLLDYGADPNVQNNDGETPLKILEDDASQNNTGSPFYGRFGGFSSNFSSNLSDEDKNKAASLADFLRSRGALEVLPDWEHITVSGPSANYSRVVFDKGTNDWNQFTLFEAVFCYGPFSFPDLSHLTIVRPHPGTTNVTKIKINLLNDAGQIDCSRDMPLEFGDTVEIPQREHTLSESDTNSPAWISQIIACLRNKAGTVKLVAEGGQTIQIPLNQFNPDDCRIGDVLRSSQAQNVLTSDSDFSRVKVIRAGKEGKTMEWTLDCNGNSSDLWLRDGDVIEVPEKP